MKLIKTASGKKTIKISKREWQAIGKKAGWMKTASAIPAVTTAGRTCGTWIAVARCSVPDSTPSTTCITT